MKKQKKQFFGMLLVLAVLAAAYGGIHVYNQKPVSYTYLTLPTKA